jgi:hypothetical protein
MTEQERRDRRFELMSRREECEDELGRIQKELDLLEIEDRGFFDADPGWQFLLNQGFQCAHDEDDPDYLYIQTRDTRFVCEAPGRWRLEVGRALRLVSRSWETTDGVPRALVVIDALREMYQHIEDFLNKHKATPYLTQYAVEHFQQSSKWLERLIQEYPGTP